MSTIRFLGAAGEVTGSCFQLTATDGTQILIDFGMFQGQRSVSDLNNKPLSFHPSALKGVVVTHAHLDHCGRLPLLVANGYRGKIYMTAPTAALVNIVLTDAAKVAEQKPDTIPLYSLELVLKTLELIEVVAYNEQFPLGGYMILLKDAGHILGSSSIEVTDQTDNTKIIFSGDLGNSPEDIVRPTEYFDAADVVVMESTYGDSLHPTDDPTTILCEEIQAIEREGGVLLIPAFSIERTQEILHRINHLKRDGKIKNDTPVFMDGPMGIQATTIFKDYRDYYNVELQTHDDDPFRFESLIVTQDARDSREIIKAMEPKVIIAGSGMMSGGRILHHAANYLSKNSTRLLFVGYQAEETLGHKILKGAKQVWINDKPVKVRASVREVKSFSAHADQRKLLDWLTHIKHVKKVFLVHGEAKQRETLAQEIKGKLGVSEVILPMDGDEYSF